MPSYTREQVDAARQLSQSLSSLGTGLSLNSVVGRTEFVGGNVPATALVLAQIPTFLNAGQIVQYQHLLNTGSQWAAERYAVDIILAKCRGIISGLSQGTISIGSTGTGGTGTSTPGGGPPNNSGVLGVGSTAQGSAGIGSFGIQGTGQRLGGYLVDPSTGLPAGVSFQIRNPATGQLEAAVRDPSNGHFRLRDGSGWVTLTGQFIPSGHGGAGGGIGTAGATTGAGAGGVRPTVGPIDSTGYPSPVPVSGTAGGSCSGSGGEEQTHYISVGGTSEHGQQQRQTRTQTAQATAPAPPTPQPQPPAPLNIPDLRGPQTGSGGP